MSVFIYGYRGVTALGKKEGLEIPPKIWSMGGIYGEPL